MEWKLDRELPIPISEQIKGQIVYAISFGTMQPGETLLSVRELAGILKVSPATVAKVYRKLIKDGLLVSKPYVGVFVNELGMTNGNNHSDMRQHNLHGIIVNAIRQAKLMGYSMDHIRDAFMEIDNQMVSADAKTTILMVGNFNEATYAYARKMESMLEDINIKVVPITLTDLITRLPEMLPVIKTASLAVTVPQRLQDVRAILEPEYIRVVAIAFDLSQETIQQLSDITPDQKVGIVCTYPEYVHTMVNELAAHGLTIQTPLIALIAQEERVRDMLSEINVLVYATGSSVVRERAPKDLLMFEFLHTPSPESVNCLRAMIERDIVGTNKSLENME
jgi:DNA-binding transcriptional regulator YhcF (GntR family)